MLTIAAISKLGLFLQTIENGVTVGAVYALVALGYTLVYGIIELINFAHGDVFMWSTVVTLVIVQAMGIKSGMTGFGLVIMLLFLIVIGMIVSGGINVAIERFAYRPLRRAPRLAPLIAAIGISFLLENIAQLWRGSGFTAFPTIFPTGFISLGGVHIAYLHIFIILLSVGLMYGLATFINVTKLGRAMRATAQDPEAAALMGVNINRTISVTFLVGGALAGAAGVIYNMFSGQVWFFTGFQLGLIAFTAAVLGGIGNIYGAVVGGFIIGLIQNLTIQYVHDGLNWSNSVVFALLVIILIVRPSGLLGQQVPDKV